MRSSKQTNHCAFAPMERFVTEHPIAVGSKVTIFKIQNGQAPFVEGCAVVELPAISPHAYWVRFPGDPLLKQRVVFYDYQNNPERLLEILQSLWRSSNTPEIDEFFLERPSQHNGG
ncbi:MAG TPA: hypothetical protein VH206_09705 [Xanthobacteraceae bacterium]|jgi:hypothetical protein|nr:hypothetical protein [Xanthobacteraceae bacterium]